MFVLSVKGKCRSFRMTERLNFFLKGYNRIRVLPIKTATLALMTTAVVQHLKTSHLESALAMSDKETFSIPNIEIFV